MSTRATTWMTNGILVALLLCAASIALAGFVDDSVQETTRTVSSMEPAQLLALISLALIAAFVYVVRVTMHELSKIRLAMTRISDALHAIAVQSGNKLLAQAVQDATQPQAKGTSA